MTKFAAWLWIGPTESPEFTWEDESPIGIQRYFETDEMESSPFARDMLISTLATKIAHAVFGVTGDEDLYRHIIAMVHMKVNVSISLGGGMRATVYPANSFSGGNSSLAEPIDYFTDTHRED